MTRIDPITGCHVMTIHEMAALEAERDGTTVDQVLADFFQNIDDDTERWEKELDHNLLSEVKKELTRMRDEHEVDEYVPIPIIRIHGKVDASQSLKSSGWVATLRARADDDFIYDYRINWWSSSGDFYEPPSEELEIGWKEVKPDEDHRD